MDWQAPDLKTTRRLLTASLLTSAHVPGCSLANKNNRAATQRNPAE